MNSDTVYYRRNLPHFQHGGAIYSVVFRLDGSLPADVILHIQDEYRQMEKAIKKINGNAENRKKLSALREEYFRKFDSLLDNQSFGPHWLGEDAIAKITADAIRFLDGSRYTLIAYCIMPNHVHLIVALGEKNNSSPAPQKSPYVLTRILHSLKRHTARESNKLLHCAGAFWQHESYDHIIRDSDELRRSVEYVINNPVAAGLAQRWEDWKWTYVNKDWLEKNT